MLQLLFHAIGDYLTQNDWVAVNKVKNTKLGYFACILHSLLYSLPFLFITSLYGWLFILISHFFIDKYRLAVYWLKLVNWNWSSKNFGFSEDKPFALSIWLLIIVDNIFHLICNYISVTYL